MSTEAIHLDPHSWASLSFLKAVLIILVTATEVSAQYRIESWNTESGLPQNSVLAILQTRDGYLWLATNDGLVRYNGVRFEVFDSGNTQDLCCNRLTALFEDHHGTLWIGTDENRIIKYENQQFSSYETEKGKPRAGAIAIRLDKDGNLIIAKVDRSGLLRMRNGGFVAEAGADYYHLSKSGEEAYSIGDRLMRSANGREITYRMTGGTKFVNIVYEDSQGALWIGTDQGLWRLKSGRFESISLGPKGARTQVHALSEDGKGTLWIGTGEGLFRYADGRSTKFELNQALSESATRSIFTDREGVVWVGTYQHGLFKITETIIKTFSQKDGIVSENVYSIFEDSRGRIWIGSWPGVTTYENGRFTPFNPPGLGTGHYALSFAEDKRGRLWISAGGVWWYRDGELVSFDSQMPKQASGVHAILPDRSGAIWFGSDRGLVKYADGAMTVYTTKDGLADGEVKSLLEDRSGGLWIGTRNGLSRFHNGAFTTFTTKEGLRSNHIRAIHEDEEGTIWVGSFDGGLTRLRDGRMTTYGPADGLACKGVFAIVDDARGNFWMSCNLGIYRVSKLQLNAFADGKLSSINSVAYGSRDGMDNSECNGGSQPAGVRTRDGKLWFPTASGVAVVDLERVSGEMPSPLLSISRVEADQRLHSYQSRLSLGTSPHRLDIYYDCLTFSRSGAINFRYMMDGLERSWIETRDQRVATYSDIPPGEYRFRLAALGVDGQWNEMERPLLISISKPFWSKWWFRSLGLLAFISVLVLIGQFFHHRSVAKLMKQHESDVAFSRRLIESQENERRRVARELHDDVVNDLASFAISLHNLTSLLPGDAGDLRRRLKGVNDRAVALAERVRTISHSLHSASLQQLGVSAALKTLCHEFRTRTKVDLDLFVDESIVSVGPDADTCLFRIVQEALRNVEKYSQAKSALVTLKRVGNGVELFISDDGVGFDPKLQGSTEGLGLVSMRERVESLGGTIVIAPTIGRGVEIVVNVPVAASATTESTE